MAELPESFDPQNVPEDDRSFDPIPAGNYNMQIIDSKLEDTKSGNGKMLVLTEEVIDGQYANRRIWDRLNIQHENPDAQRIAQRSLADLCLTLGIVELSDSEELHFKPFVGKVSIAQDKTGQYGPQNRVRYSSGATQPPAGKTAPKPTAAPARAPQKAGAAPAKKPWAK